jgi:sucrose-6-phosphate hydrolase SacC (GH32 family)
LAFADGHVSLHIFLDTSSIEVFGDGGRVVLTELFLPSPGRRTVTLFADGPQPKVEKLEVWELKSAWH